MWLKAGRAIVISACLFSFAPASFAGDGKLRVPRHPGVCDCVFFGYHATMWRPWPEGWCRGPIAATVAPAPVIAQADGSSAHETAALATQTPYTPIPQGR